MKNLLIISCSATKKKTFKKIPAWELYDGVIFRVLKKNNIDFNKWDVAIISAKYGLIFPETPINYYEQLMTRKRAVELKEKLSKQIKKLINRNYRSVEVCLGKNYLISSGIEETDNINLIEGGIGEKMHFLKKIINNG